MAFDGVTIANDGTVHFRARERIFFTSLITLKPTGSTARAKVGVQPSQKVGAHLEGSFMILTYWIYSVP